MQRFKEAALHALKVAGHIVWSVVLLGVITYVLNNEVMPEWFSTALTQYGVPAAAVNVIWSGFFKWVKSRQESAPAHDYEHEDDEEYS